MHLKDESCVRHMQKYLFFKNYLEFISYRFQTCQFLYELQSIFFDKNRGENTLCMLV